MVDHREDRISALRELFPAAEVEGLLVTSNSNIRYLTGFSGSSAILLVTARDLLFVTDFRYQTQVVEEVGDLARVVIESNSLWDGVWREMGRATGACAYGFESIPLGHRDFQRLLEGGSRWKWRPTQDMVESLREKKDAGEVRLIERAAEIATAALASTLAQVRPGMSELQVAGVLEKALRDAGSEGFPFPSIVASGPRSALPHARTSAREIKPGELLLLDFGAETSGYCADITRTVVVGRAGGREREVHEIVRVANETASAGVRAGMKGKDADGLARSYIERYGYGDAFGHGLGHGIGLQVHEAPRLARTAEGILPAGSVVTIEPGVYIPGWGGVRIEDDVHLESNGPRILTHFSRELIEIA